MKTNTLDPITELELRIADACASTQPKTKARNAALSAIRWRMKSADGFYAGLLGGVTCKLYEDVNNNHVQTFTGCDNHALKLAFWSRAVGEPLTLELL